MNIKLAIATHFVLNFIISYFQRTQFFVNFGSDNIKKFFEFRTKDKLLLKIEFIIVIYYIPFHQFT